MDNRIIIIARRITSLASPEISGIEKGEFFYCTSLGQTFYRDHETGEITRQSELPTYLPSTVTYASNVYTLNFNSFDKLFLVTNQTRIIFTSPTGNTTGAVTIKIGTVSYPLRDFKGVALLSGAITSNSTVELVFDGANFRLITGSSRISLAGTNMDYGRI